MQSDSHAALIQAIRASLADQGEEIEAGLQEEQYATCRITPSSFVTIRDQPAQGQLGTLTAVDGGNAELIRAPHLSVQWIRLASVSYGDTEGDANHSRLRRISSTREDFFALIATEGDSGRNFTVRRFPEPENKATELSFDPEDRRLRVGLHAADPTMIGGVVRRIAELEFATKIASGLRKESGNVLLLDGTLEATYPFEEEALGRLRETCSQRGAILASLAKRCSLLTSSGRSLLPSLTRIGPRDRSWRCALASGRTDRHPARIFAVRLHPAAKHIFRCELDSAVNEKDDDSLFSSLARQAREATFPGYPYGLIEADRLARISRQETQTQRVLLESRMGTAWQGIAEHLASLDAHDILDRMQY